MKNYLSAMIISLSFATQAATKKILVVLSGEDKITLQNGVIHPTGFFLSELMVPIDDLIKNGYEPIFATPSGKKPTMDKISDSAFWFGDDEVKYQQIKALYGSLEGIKQPYSFKEILQQNLESFAGVFVPGGHAPMEDLLKDKDLGSLLRYFHNAQKPTALICHGPIALLAALEDSEEFLNDLSKGNSIPNNNCIYSGYSMTSFSTAEEMQEEPGEDNVLGGYVKFYPDHALSVAGGRVRVADKWKSHVVRDRELITAQNPMSDHEFTKAFIQSLNEQQ